MRSLLASLFFCYGLTALAQLPTDIKFTNYTRATGLPEENINNIIQDSRGFLWIGSHEGLIRFDGHSYKIWYADPSDSSKFSNNMIILAGEYRPGKILFLSGSKLWDINIYDHRLEIVKNFKQKVIAMPPHCFANKQWLV